MKARIRTILVTLLAVILISGCIQEMPENGSRYNTEYGLNIYTYCADNIVCYYHPDGYAGGMGCFHDEELAEKYCYKKDEENNNVTEV